jgi:hypothetical protein
MLLLIWAKGAFFGLLVLLGGLALGLPWWQALLLSAIPFFAAVLQFARRPIYAASLALGVLGPVVLVVPQEAAALSQRASDLLSELISDPAPRSED